MSERRFYQKITDIYATALDYDKSAKTTRLFFAEVQNKLHWAIHRHTAAELIMERANAEKPHMGLTSWERYPDEKIQKYGVSIAKNDLSKEELQAPERIVAMYLDYAEYQASRHIPMAMQDGSQRLNRFLGSNEHEILHDTGRMAHEIAKMFVESEFEKYGIVQDQLLESDFYRFLALEEERRARSFQKRRTSTGCPPFCVLHLQVSKARGRGHTFPEDCLRPPGSGAHAPCSRPRTRRQRYSTPYFSAASSIR